MCFIIDAKHPNVKIAKRNIPCYKRLCTDGNETFSPLMREIKLMMIAKIQKR